MGNEREEGREREEVGVRKGVAEARIQIHVVTKSPDAQESLHSPYSLNQMETFVISTKVLVQSQPLLPVLDLTTPSFRLVIQGHILIPSPASSSPAPLTTSATVPAASIATPVGYENDEAVPSPSADPMLPLPARVETRPEEMTMRRMRLLPPSACRGGVGEIRWERRGE